MVQETLPETTSVQHSRQLPVKVILGFFALLATFIAYNWSLNNPMDQPVLYPNQWQALERNWGPRFPDHFKVQVEQLTEEIQGRHPDISCSTEEVLRCLIKQPSQGNTGKTIQADVDAHNLNKLCEQLTEISYSANQNTDLRRAILMTQNEER